MSNDSARVDGVKVMWELKDGSELGIIVEVYDIDDDESIITRAWHRVTAWFHPSLRPSDRSDMKIRKKRGRRR